MKTVNDKAGVQATREGKGPAARVAPEVLRVVSGSDPNRRGRVPGVTGGGGTGAEMARQRGKGGTRGTGQDGGDREGRRGLRVSE